MKLQTMTILGSAFATGMLASTALAVPNTITHDVVLVEEFTATWCGYCGDAYDTLERGKEHWGDEIAILSYNTGDIPYSSPYTERRANEAGVWGIPWFWFHGTYTSIGTPSDGQFNNYVSYTQNQIPDARVIARYIPNEAAQTMKLKMKFHSDMVFYHDDELRVVVWEETFVKQWQRPDFKYHVTGGYDFYLGLVNNGQEIKGQVTIDISDLASRIQTWDDLGMTIYMWNSETEEIRAAWDIGLYNLGDLNGDLTINMTDGNLFLDQIGKNSNDPDFNPAADWDQDDDVDNDDRALFQAYVDNGGLL